MQKCYNCGKEVDDNVLICPDCGALVKRYGKPVPVEPDPYPQSPQPDAYPPARPTGPLRTPCSITPSPPARSRPGPSRWVPTWSCPSAARGGAGSSGTRA